MNSRRPLLLAADAAGDPRRFLYGYDTANIGSALNFVPYGLPGLAQGYVVACCARQDSLRLLMRPCGTCPTRLTSIMPRSPADINHTAAAAVPISGLTAWQGLFDHAQLKTSQTLLVHGAAGGVGSIAVQLAHELGRRVEGVRQTRDHHLGDQADRLPLNGPGLTGVRAEHHREVDQPGPTQCHDDVEPLKAEQFAPLGIIAAGHARLGQRRVQVYRVRHDGCPHDARCQQTALPCGAGTRPATARPGSAPTTARS